MSEKHAPMAIKAGRALSDIAASSCSIDVDEWWAEFKDQWIADAQSILDACGATELLEVLQEYVTHKQRVCAVPGSTLDKARAAIAKATGGQHMSSLKPWIITAAFVAAFLCAGPMLDGPFQEKVVAHVR